MILFRKKCEYCKKKIEKGKETFRDVKIPGFIGTRKRAFCCSEHANMYEKEVAYLNSAKKGCCS